MNCELDLSRCTDKAELYAAVREQLSLPRWCGENLDALWDALTGLLPLPAHIVAHRAAAAGMEEQVEKIITLLLEAALETDGLTLEVID